MALSRWLALKISSMLALLAAHFRSYVANDSPQVLLFMKFEWGVWYYLSGMFIDIKNWKGIIGYILFFGVSFIFIFTFTLIGTINGFIIMSEDLPYACFLLYGAINGTWALSIFLSTVLGRNSLFKSHSAINNNFFTYDFETLDKADRIRKFHAFFKSKFNVIPVVAMLSVTFMLGFVSFVSKPKAQLESNLFVPMYYPFPISSVALKLILSFLMLAYVLVVLTTAFFGIFIFLNSSLHRIFQQQRLIDSINSLDQRASVLFGKSCSSKVYKISDLNKTEQPTHEKDYFDCYVRCIIENIKHHHKIKCYDREIQAAVGLGLGTILILSSLLLALLILLIKNGSFIVPSILMLLSLAGLFAAATIGQLQMDMDIELRQAVFETDWTFSNRKVVSYIKILLEITKEPPRPCVLRFIYYDKIAFLAIMKAAYSYYNFLRITGEMASGSQ